MVRKDRDYVRDTSGRFADDPNKKGMPTGKHIKPLYADDEDNEPAPADKTMSLQARRAASIAILRDPDIADAEPWARYKLSHMLDGATVTSGDQPGDKPLIIANLTYSNDPGAPGGSHADYLANALDDAWRDKTIHVKDRAQLIRETRGNIIQTAIDPNREFDRLGLQRMTPLEESNRQHMLREEQFERTRLERLQWETNIKAQRNSGAQKSADTRRNRIEQATEQHLAPLEPQMRELYRTNVDRGLINGSANEDRWAFADALTELQADGWDPEAGKAYRKSAGFKRLEKQLLDGRKPTRRYRQMRDALCDNEDEYKSFMAAKPDVFDPDEKIVKPFCGLGPDVGQQAMLRLAAKHRGVDGALQLARRDPDIIYTIGDAKTHTFSVTRDQYPGDDQYTHRAVTANGIKPATVMPWIMNETPGGPEWEERTRRRFEESNGGSWRSHDSIV